MENKPQTKITKLEWFDKHQTFEKKWWGEGCNTLGEEIKQITYAKKMGLTWGNVGGKMTIDVQNKSIMDIGGGYTSLLLKTVNLGFGIVVEPLQIPAWAMLRYMKANINVSTQPAEELSTTDVWDEVWIYNVLQHTFDPEKILSIALDNSRIVRIFEWINTPPHEGHPITLTQKNLDAWLGGTGRTEFMDAKEWNGYNQAYYGVFKGKHYEEAKI